VKAQATPYRRVWRWHFFAGLLVAPVLLVLALTGALYLFDAEIDAWWTRDIGTVAPTTAARPLGEQEAAVQAAYPGATLKRYQHPPAPDRAAIWGLETRDGRALDVYVDPYRARIAGTLDSGARPMAIAAALHGRLMAGRVGGWVVEAAACWTLVLVVTGLYLWWPRRWRWSGVLVPRLAHGERRRWRDLHAIPGAVNAVLVLFLVLSGLPWSGFWGVQLASLGTLSAATEPSPNFRDAPPVAGVSAATGHAHDTTDVALPWAVRHAPVPAGQPGAFTLEQLLALALERGVRADEPRLRLLYPTGPQGVFTVSHVTARAQDQRTLYVDPRDGRVVDDIGWDRYSPLAKAVEWGVMVHLGRQYGLANQLAGLAVCGAIVVAVVAGVVHWWRRRPAGGWGTPQAPAREALPPGLRWTLVVLAVLFPLVGLTLLAAWALDALATSRGPSAPA
jgi:uncharacterized iron-regulated membrane protein